MIKGKNSNPIIAGLFICVLTALLVSVGGFWFLHHKLAGTALNGGQEGEEYTQHYAFIVENSRDAYWGSVYEAAREEGKKHGVYVEQMGDNLPEDYSVEDLMKAAIASGVDGILLQCEKEEAGEVMTKAMEQNISVVTMLNDNFYGKRRAFVGVNGTDMGKAYAEQIKRVMVTGREKICVLVDTLGTAGDNNLIISGIRKSMVLQEDQLVIRTLSGTDGFGAEETIRSLILDEKEPPDILVSLSATDTLYASQSLVDYNKVGKISLIGSFESEEIREALQKKILSSVVTVPAHEIGEKAVIALVEYQEQGVVNEYQPVSCGILDSNGGEP